MDNSLDITKLKVPELRAELSKRGLNTFGTKQVLVDRLSQAINGADDKPGEHAPEESNVAEEQQNNTSSPGEPEKPEENNEVIEPINDSQAVVENAVPEKMQDSTEQMPVDPEEKTEETAQNTEEVDQSKVVESEEKPETESLKRKWSPSRSPRRRSRSRSRSRSRDRDRDRDSRRSPRRRSRSPSARSKMCTEVDDWEKSESVFLDIYNCDLNLIIDDDFYTAKPQTEGGFCLMWAGARANYGVTSGKSFFEVRNVKHMSVENLDSMTGGSAHVMRVGWSTETSEFALGEEPFSYGYGGTAKKSCNNEFSDYGCSFGEGDVVGAFLEWTDNEFILRYSVNGVDQGECFRVAKDSMGDNRALFPHVYVKNVEFTVNFGQNGQTPWFPPAVPGDDAMSWKLLNDLSPECKHRGRLPPPSKSECEAIMMIGLPGSGKTYYADRLRLENREKQYNVLGTNYILDRMKVMGLARQRNYHGRWDVLIDKATKCLNVLISLAAMRRRNYILDQTNVYPSAQRRKMRPFEGFKRKAIVIVPTDEEFRRRIAQREKEEGKEVPESAVLEMKANFGIPKSISEDSSSVFDELLFTELDRDEAVALVEKYNQEGQSSRPPPEKRQRWGSRDRESNSGSRDSRNRDGGRDNYYGGRGRRDDFRRSPRRDDRGRRDYYRGGYNAERDRSRDNDRFDRNRSRDNYRGQPGGYYGGPASRYGGPPLRGGPFPPAFGGGYYDGGARGGGMMMMRGRGRGAGPYNAPPPHYDMSGPAPLGYHQDTRRPPRGGRGDYRGGPTSDRNNPAAAGSQFGARPSRFDSHVPADSYGAATGGYQGGGYRGGYASRRGGGFGQNRAAAPAPQHAESGSADAYQSAYPEDYSSSSSMSNRYSGAFPGGTNPPAPMAPSYQRGYPSSGFSTAAEGDMADSRRGRVNRPDADKQQQQQPPPPSDSSSLYASGSVARYGGAGNSAQRQSRFDKSPNVQPPQQQQPPLAQSAYAGGYANAYGANASGPRPNRSRFDVGPGGASQQQQPPQQQQQQQNAQQVMAQAYGYGYAGAQSKGSGAAQASQPSSTGAAGSYGSFGGYSAGPQRTANPVQQPQQQQQQQQQQQSLYASAVGSSTTDKMQAVSTGASNQNSNAQNAAAMAAAYANYYGGGYGGQSMMTAQQYNTAWQQQQQQQPQQPTSQQTANTGNSGAVSSAQQANPQNAAAAAAAAAVSYANYYQGYQAQSQPQQQQYYAGYR